MQIKSQNWENNVKQKQDEQQGSICNQMMKRRKQVISGVMLTSWTDSQLYDIN